MGTLKGRRTAGMKVGLNVAKSAKYAQFQLVSSTLSICVLSGQWWEVGGKP